MVRRLQTIAALCVLACATPGSAQQEIENVAAFARLYGVARWFYPSDAAAALDWNRFAVDGVRRVRGARTLAELETTLEELFTPLGSGIEIGALPAKRPTGARDPALIAWHYRGAAINGENVPGPYSAKRTNRVTPTRSQPAATSRSFAQVIAADTLRGKVIRMRGQVRIADPNAQGWAGLWLRVDRTGQTVGFFDNMQNRPVRDTAWREYVIEGSIDSDAERIVFGALSVGAMTVDVDAIELTVRDAAGNWTPLVIPDASFETPANGGGRGWSQGAYVVIRPVFGAAHGERFARMTPPVVSQALPAPALPSDSLETPIAGASIDVELTRGLKARVPLSLTDAEARAELPALTTLRAALANISSTAGRNDADVRLADAIVAWNVFRHFYPYWGDISVDWDARLRPQLETALGAAETREAHLDAIRTVVADLRDGHGGVYDVASRPSVALLPVQFRILGERLVVTASTDAEVPVGSIVTAINGTPASTRIDKETQLASGTLQWRQSRAASALQTCRLESTVTVTIEPPSGSERDVRLPCNRSVTRAVEARPDSIVELQPGIWYVDLTRVRAAQLRPMLETLAKARGVVVDMRGYPTDAGVAVLPHLMRTPEDSTDRWMHVSRIARPFGEVAGWQSMSWNLRPATPHIGGQRVFLTDGRAISYAESVMGYVRDYKLGTIIGGATAGANGNVASFSVPGGFSVAFTGMRVTRHDGRTPFHTEGVSPDIPLAPTLAGIRAGRDELLERALAALRIQP
jgi:hypothetical protein